MVSFDWPMVPQKEMEELKSATEAYGDLSAMIIGMMQMLLLSVGLLDLKAIVSTRFIVC